MIKKSPSLKLVTSTFLMLASLGLGHGQTTWDFGASPDQNWSTFTNWSTDADPAATAVVFGNTGTTANASTVGNIVDSSYTGANALNSLTFSNTGVNVWQVTQIAAGQTLTVGGAFRVGTTAVGTGTTTLAAITGSGTLAVNAPSSSFAVASSSSTGNAGRATLDLSNLSAFTANVSTFDIGNGTSGNGTLFLADNSTITATTFNTGGSGSSYGSGITNNLYFGTTTVMNVDTFAFGGGRTYGNAQFRPASSGAANSSAVSNGLLTIRGSAGGNSAVANMTIGAFNGSMQGATTSTFNLTGGTVDALVTNLTIGSSASALTTAPKASLLMASGTFNAANVTLAQTTTNNGSTGSITGTLDVSGGSFIAGTMTMGNNGAGAANTRGSVANLNVSGSGSVHVTGNLVMGVRNGAGTVTPTVTISAGTLLIDGSLAEGTGAGANIVSTVNLSGGVLDMTQGTVAVDTFTITGGTLKNVSSFTADTTGGLAMQNATLGFDNINNVSANALVLTGTFSLTGTTDLSLSLANGFNPGTGNILLVDNNLGDSISGTFATVNGAAGSTFTLTNDQGSFQYQLSYTGGDGNDLVAIAVPEPSTCLLLGLGLTGLLWRRRLHRIS